MNKNDPDALLLMWQGYSRYAYAWRLFTVFLPCFFGMHASHICTSFDTVLIRICRQKKTYLFCCFLSRYLACFVRFQPATHKIFREV